MLGMGVQVNSSQTDYVPFHDLKAVQITNVIYSDSDSDAYVEGIADGNRKIHIDVDDGKIPSNFKNTNKAIVFEEPDKTMYLNQKMYDEDNSKTSKDDVHTALKSFFVCTVLLSIGMSALIATVLTKNNEGVSKRTN